MGAKRRGGERWSGDASFAPGRAKCFRRIKQDFRAMSSFFVQKAEEHFLEYTSALIEFMSAAFPNSDDVGDCRIFVDSILRNSPATLSEHIHSFYEGMQTPLKKTRWKSKLRRQIHVSQNPNRKVMRGDAAKISFLGGKSLSVTEGEKYKGILGAKRPKLKKFSGAKRPKM